MSGVRLILALHDHQPVGNFDGVFETAYRDSYLPFLEVMEGYPDIPFVLHTSGPLLEWLVERQPDYVARVRALVESGRVEILGGGFHEPILTMIPHRDRVGQIRSFATYLEDLFGQKVRGIWTPERVWEQHLVTALAEAEVEYTLLDDFHFGRAGLNEADLLGYYLTEDDGRLLKVFPISEPLRYLIPFQEPHASYEYLRRLANDHPGATVVFADDGEKFGSWPHTFDHVYKNGWLRRFCDMITANREWLQPTTLARVVDATLPLGKAYLPDSSYREMTEWVLPADRLSAYEHVVKRTPWEASAEPLRPFVRAGGFWRNFKAKYAESDEMYSRMLGLSTRLAAVAARPDADPDYLESARDELYRGQCNCPYWHGAFGGLYLPHLRNAIYRHLIAAHNALDDAEGKVGPRASVEAGDFNLDARQEIRLESDRLIAFLRPANGGQIYELDCRRTLTNVLATLDRRPEAYHRTIAAAALGHREGPSGPGTNMNNEVVFKQEGLDRLLIYDRHPRKALVDHFYPVDVSLDDLAACHDVERGDFVGGAYLAKLRRAEDWVTATMERPGWADGHAIRMRKIVALEAGGATLDVRYVLEELPVNVPLHFAIEINLAAMAGHADDRYYTDAAGNRLGTLDSRLDLPSTGGLTLTDEWLDLAVALRWSHAAGLWCLPIETVSQSEAGFEGVYQSSAVIPHWIITADESRRWEVRLTWALTPAHPEPAATPCSANPKAATLEFSA
ncbi:MAG: alpha-amylase/4-alpha-glucanotransferase domain-containing protein [Isosphaeraceae bacterium]